MMINSKRDFLKDIDRIRSLSSVIDKKLSEIKPSDSDKIDKLTLDELQDLDKIAGIADFMLTKYADKKDMQNQVKRLLEVDESKKRINKVKLLFREKVKNETRSRRDIDVVYLIGDAVQTRLLKPYFDVNISTFADKIPLYASSKSHSLQVDRTDKRDLAGLYFTEIPWMLPQGNTQPTLRAQFNQLWPQQGDLQQRLFAMGYDAVKLIPQLKQLSTLSGKSIQGLTGLLSINRDGEIHRKLQWARYYQKSIKTVDLKEVKPTPLFLQPTENTD